MGVLTRDEARERSETITLESVRVHIDLRDAHTNTVNDYPVHSSFTLRSRTPQTFLDLAGQVLALKIDGTPRPLLFEGERLTLTDLPLDRDVCIEIEARCTYSHSGEGLHRYVDPEDGRVYLYTQFEPNDAHRAWPCFDQPDMKARWSFTVDAPQGWVVASNGEELSSIPIDRGVRHEFSPTPPLSSYVTAIVAGEWAVVDGGAWRGGVDGETEIEIPLRLMCRAALASSMDCADILQVTRAGLDFYHCAYGFTYPWGTYDQIFVPEYNLGAMENPGCVTFNENYLSRETPTFAERQRRANTILHEMCHMWFGDLVTPRWWDDLWLKESFAENQGAIAAARSTVYAGERAAFAVGRKIWAYEQDQMPTTHPIAADIPDVGAAKTNFDGITYAKGAAVLDQLVAWVGEDAFFAGVRLYFRRYAFSCATFTDLLDCLGEAAQLDLSPWADAWLKTSGPSLLEASWNTDPSGAITDFTLEDTADSSVTRPHRLLVTGWTLTSTGLQRRFLSDLRMEGRCALVDPEGQLQRPGADTELDLLVLNDNDLTYAISRLDSRSRDTALAHIGSCPELMTRCVVWACLWNAVRDGLLHPSSFISSALIHAETENDDALAARLLVMVREALGFLNGATRSHDKEKALICALRLSGNDESDRARAWKRFAIDLASSTQMEGVREFLEETAVAHTQTGWCARGALAARGEVDEAWLVERFDDLPSGEAARALIRAQAALPSRQSHEKAWALITAPGTVNDHLSAAFEGLAISNMVDSRYEDLALEILEEFWNTHTIGLGMRFVTGAFLRPADIDDPHISTHRIASLRSWLDTYPNAPAPLRRLIVETLDINERHLRVQSLWARP